jgi:hypothetical protein
LDKVILVRTILAKEDKAILVRAIPQGNQAKEIEGRTILTKAGSAEATPGWSEQT